MKLALQINNRRLDGSSHTASPRDRPVVFNVGANAPKSKRRRSPNARQLLQPPAEHGPIVSGQLDLKVVT